MKTANNFQPDWESKTVFGFSGNGSFIKNPAQGSLSFLPDEIWLERVNSIQIHRKANQCLTFRSKGLGKSLMTGLKPTQKSDWFLGDFLNPHGQKGKNKVALAIRIEPTRKWIEVYRIQLPIKNNRQGKTLPEAFKL